ncbi:Gfo/Idh/MocA family oxidoreductase [Halomonas binhaiensis]|uniref:Inositol 2-dehydrogenase n=1 Tax=Halomonas binhaiensis TaxID=2562282 RepID=A0A5C1NM19_9GAMM|nr:Gfo/Idh/MocA family oxidoreductase [Halomonas binhaiensis]QEM83478.1 Gfo/Idh/MocA family oxidoreductase [Halomonas binhaiensis]
MTLSIGVIGTGAIGKEHMHRLAVTLKGARVVAASDVSIEQAETAIRDVGIEARAYASGEEVIQAEDVDAVVVTSWGPTHEQFVLAAITAGKPVFCEKPLATTAEGCMRIVEAEVAAGRPLVQVGFMRRFDAAYRQLKALLDSDGIGRPLLAKCAHRNAQANFSGDMGLIDSCVHEFDVMRWLLDDDYVSAQVIQPVASSLVSGDLQDPSLVILRTRKGRVITIESFLNCQYGYDIRCEVVGERGVADLPQPTSVPVRRNAQASEPVMTHWKDRFIDAFNVEFQEWIDATAQGKRQGPTAWDGLVAAVTSDACVKARHSGQIEPIKLPERPAFYNN